MIDISVHNETSELVLVVLGIPFDFGGTPNELQCYDPKSMEHVSNGTFPLEKDIVGEMHQFLSLLNRYEVEVLRPDNIKGLNQIFCRDIFFVIDETVVIPNIIKERSKEIEAVSYIFDRINRLNIVTMPDDARAEGGDVILFQDYIFVGYSNDADFRDYKTARTNKKGVDFLRDKFPHRQIIPFELNKSDTDARRNALHLDCCFQPIGKDMALLYEGGFKKSSDIDFLVSLFSKENIIFLTQEEMYNMYANLFSISEKVIVSEKSFSRINAELNNRGFIVEEIDYSEISKMEGLFRCSTIPIIRR